MIVVANSDRVATLVRSTGSVTAGQDTVLALTLTGDGTAARSEIGVPITSEALLIPNSPGLHARPAAVLTNLARKYTADIWLQLGEDRANAKSIVSILGMDVRYHDKVNLVAQSPDALAAIVAQIQLHG